MSDIITTKCIVHETEHDPIWISRYGVIHEGVVIWGKETDAIIVVVEGIVHKSIMIRVLEEDAVNMIVRACVVLECDIWGVTNQHPNRTIAAILVL